MTTALMTLSVADWLNTACRGFDMKVFEFFGNLHRTFLTPLVTYYSELGDSKIVIPVMVLALILCFFKKTRRYGMPVFFAILIGTLITNLILKPLIFRARPYVDLADNQQFMQWYLEAGSLMESDKSFPSGHTTAAFEIAISLMLAVKHKSIKWIFPVIAFFVGCSRIYLMVHYPTDVIGGFFVGVVAGILGYLVAKSIIFWMENSQRPAVQKLNNFGAGKDKKKESEA